MLPRVLFVDDEPNILRAFKRQLMGQFDIELATNGIEGLDLIGRVPPFAVVVADMKMPNMNGVEFLRRVREKCPTSVRVMLTGDSDQETAANAVNEGNVFRFINKPCSGELISTTLVAAVEQHRLITAEKELLQKTLSGSVKVLTDILAAIDPVSFGRGRNMKVIIHSLASAMGLENPWEIELAAMLSNIGWVVIPGVLTQKVRAGLPLTAAEQLIIDWVPEKGATLLANIPRLETVSKIVLYQNKQFSGKGFPDDKIKGQAIPIGARILAVIRDYTGLDSMGKSAAQIFSEMRSHEGCYDPEILALMERLILKEQAPDLVAAPQRFSVKADGLCSGQILLEDLQTADGILLATKGTVISGTNLDRIQNYAKLIGLKEPVYVDRLAEAVKGGK